MLVHLHPLGDVPLCERITRLRQLAPAPLELLEGRRGETHRELPVSWLGTPRSTSHCHPPVFDHTVSHLISTGVAARTRPDRGGIHRAGRPQGAAQTSQK